MVFSSQAQTGLEGFNYQTIVRNTNGSPVLNTPIQFRFTIADQANTIQYRETALITTNGSGLVNHVVGKGVVVQGTFAGIPFLNANQVLQVEADMDGGNNFQSIGTMVLRTVPYALFAASGNPGPKGDTGVQGPKGDTGATGPAGKGIVAILNFDEPNINQMNPPTNVIPNLPSLTPIVPITCRTQSYTAGPGEYALINAHGSAYLNNAVNGILNITVGVSTDAGANFLPISTKAFDTMTDGAATAGVSKYYPLTPGVSYVFGTIFESSGLVTADLLKSTCSCTVNIVKQ
jgi:hypothetical protein